MSFFQIPQEILANRHIEDGKATLAKIEADPRVRGSPLEWNQLLDELHAFKVSLRCPLFSLFDIR